MNHAYFPKSIRLATFGKEIVKLAIGFSLSLCAFTGLVYCAAQVLYMDKQAENYSIAFLATVKSFPEAYFGTPGVFFLADGKVISNAYFDFSNLKAINLLGSSTLVSICGEVNETRICLTDLSSGTTREFGNEGSRTDMAAYSDNIVFYTYGEGRNSFICSKEVSSDRVHSLEERCKIVEKSLTEIAISGNRLLTLSNTLVNPVYELGFLNLETWNYSSIGKYPYEIREINIVEDKITFVSENQIYVIEEDGEPRQLTSSKANKIKPVLSNDGEFVAFISNSHLSIVDMAGHQINYRLKNFYVNDCNWETSLICIGNLADSNIGLLAVTEFNSNGDLKKISRGYVSERKVLLLGVSQ